MPVWKGPISLPQFSGTEVPNYADFNKAFDNINEFGKGMTNLVSADAVSKIKEYLELAAQEAKKAEDARKAAEALKTQATKDLQDIKTSAVKELQNIKASATKELQDLKAQADKDFRALQAETVNQVDSRNQATLQQAQKIADAGVAQSIAEAKKIADEATQKVLDTADGALKIAKEAFEISSEVKDELRSLIDPTTGRVDRLQQILYNLFNALAPGQITAGEYDALALTAEAYDGRNIAAQDYDLRAKQILIGG